MTKVALTLSAALILFLSIFAEEFEPHHFEFLESTTASEIFFNATPIVVMI